MYGPKRGPEPSQEFIFPDWSPYTDLADAAGAYFRDPEVAMEALNAALGERPVLGFTLERMVSDDGMVWQEAAICDGEPEGRSRSDLPMTGRCSGLKIATIR